MKRTANRSFLPAWSQRGKPEGCRLPLGSLGSWGPRGAAPSGVVLPTGAPGHPAHALARAGGWHPPRQPGTALSLPGLRRDPVLWRAARPSPRRQFCSAGCHTGRHRYRHAGDANGGSAEKGAAIVRIRQTQRKCVPCQDTHAMREGISAEQRGTNLRDRKREGRTPKYAERQAGCQVGGVYGGTGGHAGPSPTSVSPLGHGKQDGSPRDSGGDETMERTGNALPTRRLEEA